MATIVGSAAGGSWNTTGAWAGGVIPTASDDVQLDATSGNITCAGTDVCRSLDCTGYTGTLSMASAGISIGTTTPGTGNVALKLVSGMTLTAGQNFVFNSTSATQQTIDTGGKTSTGFSFTGAGGSWKLTSGVTLTNTFSVTAGTVDTNGQTISCANFSSTGATARTLTLGASSFTCSASWTATGSNLTLNAGTSSITVSGNTTFNGLGLTYYNVTFTTASGANLVVGANTFNNLTATNGASKTNTFSFSANQTINGTLTLTGNSATNRYLVLSDTIGTSRTLTVNGTVTTSNTDWQDITGAGSASWDLHAITGLSGDCGGNSGITFTSPTTQTATGTASFTWSSHGWTTRVPLPQDTVSVPNSFIASRVITADMPRLGKDVSFTCTGSPLITFNATSVFGNLSLASGMTTSGNVSITLKGRGSQTLTTNAASFAETFIVDCPGGTYTLQDDLTSTSTTGSSMNSGSLDLNGHTVTLSGSFTQGPNVTGDLKLSGGTLTCTTFATNTAITRTLQFGTNGTINVTSTSTGSIIAFAGSNLTISGTGSINITTASANTRTFAAGGYNYGSINFNYTVNNSSGQLTVSGNGTTFNNFTVSDNTVARNCFFTAGATYNFSGNFTLTGPGGGLYMWLESVTAATHTLVGPSGFIMGCEHLQVQNSHASGASWYAGADSVDLTGNTGWNFSAAPTIVTKTQSAISRIATKPTKTQSAISRIANIVTKTQSAISRIQNTVTKTQSAKASISGSTTVTKTQSAISRIANNVTKTQSAIARIQNNVTKTQSALSRIQNIVTKTQTAVGRIANNVTKTQSAVARIATKPTKTQSATANILTSGTVTKTQTAVARIQNIVTKTQTAVGRIANNVTKTQSAVARIQNTPTKTQSAIAHIIQNGTKTQSATARIQTTVTKTQSAKANISAPGTKTQSAISRIAISGTKTQSVTAHIRATVTKTQAATARITVNTISKTQSAIARVANNVTKTQPAAAHIAKTVTKTQSAKARIYAFYTKTQTATAKIIGSRSITQSAIASIIQSYRHQKSQTATACVTVSVFEPPTSNINSPLYNRGTNDHIYPATPQANDLFKWFKPRAVGMTVLGYNDGTYETGREFTSSYIAQARVCYMGGHKYVVTGAERARLLAAGFTVRDGVSEL